MNNHPQRSGLSPRSIIQEVSRRTPPKTITRGNRSPRGVIVGCFSHPCKVTPSGVLTRTSSIPCSRDATAPSRAWSEGQGRNRNRCSIGSSIQLQPAAKTVNRPATVMISDSISIFYLERKIRFSKENDPHGIAFQLLLNSDWKG